MSRSTILVFRALRNCRRTAFRRRARAGTRGHIVPRPTKPVEPRNPTDLLLRTALAEVLKEPWEFILPRRGPVLLLPGRLPHVSPRVLPANTAQGIALVSADQLEALAAQAGTDHYYYLKVRVLSMDAQQAAVVNVQLFPAIARGSTPCTVDDRSSLSTHRGGVDIRPPRWWRCVPKERQRNSRVRHRG